MIKYLLALVLFIPVFSIAQSNYKPGYVINLKGDTLRGYINYRDWSQNPISIDFKPELNSNVQKFTVNDINSFEVTGYETYEKHSIKASMAGVELRNAPVGIDTTYTVETVFLEVLQQGKNCSLYDFSDDIKTRYYIKSAGMTEPEELIYKVHFEDGEKRNLITSNTFRGQLIVLVNNLNLNDLQARIQRTNYTASDLSGIVLKINGDTKKSFQSASLRNNGSIKFFIGASLNNSTLKYTGIGNPFMNSPKATSFFPKINLGINNSMGSVGRLILGIEASLTMSSFSLTSKDETILGTKTSTQTVKGITGSITPQLLYNLYNTDKLKGFLAIGVSANVSSYPTNIYTVTVSNLSSTTQNNYPEFSTLSFSTPIKAGIVLLKRTMLYAEYNSPLTPITNYASFSADITSIGLGINFILGSVKY